MSEFDDKPRIEPGTYRHYKGGMYRVLGVGCHTERHEYYVVYERLDPDPELPEMWLRPYDMFVETVEVDGKVVPRFKRLDA